MSIKKNTPQFLRQSGLSFTTIVNQTIDLIEDPASLGIYCYLASKPDNWKINNQELQSRFRKGFDFIKNRLSDLKKKGLIKKYPIRDKTTGQIIRWEVLLINHQEVENPSPSQSRIGKTHKVGFPPCGKNESNNNIDIIIKDYNISATSVAHDFVDMDIDNHECDVTANLTFNETPSFADNDNELFESEDDYESSIADYSNNQTHESETSPKCLDSKRNKDKSDYFDNRLVNKNTQNGTKVALTLEDLKSDNPFSIPEEMLRDWIYTRTKKRAPITKTSWKMICKQLQRCEENKINAVEAFELMVASGWQSLKVEWLNISQSKKSKIDNLSTAWGSQVFKSFHEIDLMSGVI